MSIEASAASSTAHPSARGTAAGSRSHAGKPGTDPADGAAGVSFLAMLTALDPQADVAVDGAGLPSMTDAAAGAVPATVVLPDAAPILVPVDPAQLLAQSPARMAAGDVASTANGAADVLSAGVAQAAPAGVGNGAAGRPDWNGKAASTDNGQPGKSATDAAVAGDATADLALEPRKSDAGLQVLDIGARLSAKVAAARTSEARASAELVQTDSRIAAAAKATEGVLAGAAALAEAGALRKEVAAAVLGRPSGERPAPRPSAVSGGAGVLAGAEQQAIQGATVGSAGPTYVIDAATPAPTVALADKMNYWVSRGVQNAEIQLDAFGGGSVDVSITVQGNEAQVEFRTDQPEARRMLQEAMPHLKNMLEGEGLMLSGGFVGTSAQSDPGAQQRRSPEAGARTVAIGSSGGMQPKEGLSSARRASGHSVDLFV